jgi:hypothetical protein
MVFLVFVKVLLLFIFVAILFPNHLLLNILNQAGVMLLALLIFLLAYLFGLYYFLWLLLFAFMVLVGEDEFAFTHQQFINSIALLYSFMSFIIAKAIN